MPAQFHPALLLADGSDPAIAHKPLLARLLARENLCVVTAPVDTASFNLATRTLTVPFWSALSSDVYDLFLGHEVSHALHTPRDAWLDAVKDAAPSTQSWLNILEDVRIERLIKRRYPGLPLPMRRAYDTLFEAGFFGVKASDVPTLRFADRLNLRAKCGTVGAFDDAFTEDEAAFYEQVKLAETFDDILALLPEFKKLDTASVQRGGVSVGEGEEGLEGGEESSFQTLDAETRARRALKEYLEVLDLTPPILLPRSFPPLHHAPSPALVSANQLLEYSAACGDSDRSAAKKKWGMCLKKSAWLLQVFERRKAAHVSRRTRTGTRGELDDRRLWQTPLTDQVFRVWEEKREGKNHGVILLVDFSGSMQGVLTPMLLQVLTVALFCRRAGIPFQALAFTSVYAARRLLPDSEHVPDATPDAPELLETDPMTLLELCSSAQTSFQFRRSAHDLLTMKQLGPYELGNTPLNAALVHLPAVAHAFRAQYRVEVMTTIVFTDGEASDGVGVLGGGKEFKKDVKAGFQVTYPDDPFHYPVLLPPRGTNQTNALLTEYARVSGSRVIGFFLVDDDIAVDGTVREFMRSYVVHPHASGSRAPGARSGVVPTSSREAIKALNSSAGFYSCLSALNPVHWFLVRKGVMDDDIFDWTRLTKFQRLVYGQLVELVATEGPRSG